MCSETVKYTSSAEVTGTMIMFVSKSIDFSEIIITCFWTNFFSEITATY